MDAGSDYHSYVCWYLVQSITVSFDGIWDKITATLGGIWDSLSQLRLTVSDTGYYSYV
jgi:hypothetical protein